MTEHDRPSLAAFRRERAKREAKAEPRCPACGESMPKGALDHERRRHVDLYIRRQQQKGNLL